MLQEYRPALNEALRSGLSQNGAHVYHMLRYYMGWVDVDGNACSATEGKALRPTLCLFACEAAGGHAGEAMPAAVALEFIHNFSLIHDDIQDRDRTRHGRETLWAVWGVPSALSAGNILRVIANMSLANLVEHGVEPDRALQVTELLTEAYLEMIEGQYLDISYEGRSDISIRDYMGMISRKTGALIRCSVNMGAMIGTRDLATIDAFRRCGRSLGYAFQVRDDFLGVWGDEGTTGKPVGADIRRKKNSLPVVYAMSQADGQDRRVLLEAYGKDSLDDDDVSVVLDVMEHTGAKDYSETLARQHGDEALEALADVELSPGARAHIEELVHFLTVRQH